MKSFVYFRIYSFILFLHTCMFPGWCFHHQAGNIHLWHKVMLMGYSVRLELTRVCSLNGFQLVMGFMNTGPSFFLECVSFSLLYPTFTFDIWYVVCVCLLEWFRISLIVIFSLCICERVSSDFLYIYICLFPFVCVYDSSFIQLWFKFILKNSFPLFLLFDILALF